MVEGGTRQGPQKIAKLIGHGRIPPSVMTHYTRTAAQARMLGCKSVARGLNGQCAAAAGVLDALGVAPLGAAGFFRKRSPRILPSGKVTCRNKPPCSPLRSGFSTTVTLSPGFRAVERQPCRARLLGLFSSTPHLSEPPAALGTSISIQECGLV